MDELKQITVEKEDKDSNFRAEDMKLRHKECGGLLKLTKTDRGHYVPHWDLKCGRCDNETTIRVGKDTTNICLSATDGQMRTLSGGQTVEQVPRTSRAEGGFG